MELTSLSIHETSQLIQSGKLSPVELTLAHLRRIESLEPMVNCFITLTPELALEQAHQVEARLLNAQKTSNRQTSPLLGIPLAFKDLYETQGVKTTAGSTFFSTHIPPADAAVVRMLRRAGVVMLGKLNMHEIALGVTNVNPHFGACHNPWALDRIPGGSSGGSAAALAAGMCMGSLGTDSGGSIRIPSALCGIVGLKPTYGRVSLRGVIPLSWNVDHAGPMARWVADIAILLQAIAGYDRLDPYSIRVPVPDYTAHITDGVRGWRIALAEGDFFVRTDPEVYRAVIEAGRVFTDLGAQVKSFDIPDLLPAAQANHLIVTSDAAAYHREHLQQNPDGFGADVLQRLSTGAAFTSTEYILARRTQTLLRRQFEQLFDQVDLVFMPTTPVAAPPIEGPNAVEQARLLTRYTAPFNMTGLPAISLPCGFTSQSLPIGLQMVARPWAEARLLQAAYSYEQATPWHERKPNLE
jgi:aspartyl-tRNA(Asn)/glutamyl-tRNA(Gln) amidotransferase subunit A